MTHFAVLVAGDDMDALLPLCQQGERGTVPDKCLAFHARKAEGLAEYEAGSAEFVVHPDGASRPEHPTSACFHRNATPAEDAAIEAGTFTGRYGWSAAASPGGSNPGRAMEASPAHPRPSRAG